MSASTSGSIADMDRPCGGLLADPNVSERLDALYGAEPRRIYGALVLADAGASISEYRGTILRVSAASEESGHGVTRRAAAHRLE